MKVMFSVKKPYSRSILLLGSLDIILGLTVLIGWYIKSTTLIQIHNAFVPMQYNTALGFLLCGIGLIALHYNFSKTKLLVGGLLVIIGFLTLLQYIFGLNFGIDELAMDHYILTKTSHPGRMAPNTALCFLLAGLYILCSFIGAKARKELILSILSSLIIALGLVALTGYFSKVESAYGWGNLTRMAIHTSIGFIIFGFGSLRYSWWISFKQVYIPNWFFIAVGISANTIAILIWQALVAVFSNPNLISGSIFDLPTIILITGIIASLLLSIVIFFWQNLLNSRNQLRISNKELEELHKDLELKVANRTTEINEKNEELLQINEELISALEQIEQSEAQLRVLNATKDKFFSIIAHDLKSPFNTLIGFSELLLERIDEKDYDGIHKLAEQIFNVSSHSFELLQNLLEWSMNQSGDKQFKPEEIDLNSFLDQETKLLQNLASQKRISLNTDLSDKLKVNADRNMLSTIIRNLVSNAIKYTNPKGNVIISAKPIDSFIQISVSDTGVGIQPHFVTKLFKIEETYSTKGTHNEEGTGLGLALCKDFTEKHGGKIWLESETGKGSIFRFTIPSG